MERLKSLRKEKDLTLEELAQALGMTKQVLSRYERGEREADYKTLVKIADFFEVSIDYLIGHSVYYFPDMIGKKSDNDDEIEVLELYSSLSPSRKEDLMIYLRALSGTTQEKNLKSKKLQ